MQIKQITIAAAAAVLCHHNANAFTVLAPHAGVATRPVLKLPSSTSSAFRSMTPLRMAADADQDNEIERLRLMAAKLRAEASALEAEKAQSLADAAERAFRGFDKNNDGEGWSRKVPQG